MRKLLLAELLERLAQRVRVDLLRAARARVVFKLDQIGTTRSEH